MAKLSIEELDIEHRKVLVRVDFNVPIRDRVVTDDQRIAAALPTIRHALGRDAALILCSHLGRPKGRPTAELSLKPVAACLEKHLGSEVRFAEDCVGTQTGSAAAGLEPGGVLLLENLRFHPGEENPDSEPGFAEELAGLAERYVNDAFGTAHRAHASMVAVARCFERPAAGFLLKRELDYFDRVLSAPEEPFVALLGGAKVSDKIKLIENMLDRVDVLLLGGAMAYTFLAAREVPIGASRVEADSVALARRILDRSATAGVDFELPVDHVCGREFEADTERITTEGPPISEGWMGLDIGPRTVERYAERIGGAGTVIWNGPMGVFEWEPFAQGTMALARACAESRALTIVGGGDSASAARQSGLADRFDHISTGGGASLELLEGKSLPGVTVLCDRA